MKKLASKQKVAEAKLLRKQHKNAASDCAREAKQYREDSLKLGVLLAQAGVKVYKNDHPVYEELIMPLLDQAAAIAAKYGFNVLYQTQTPIEEMPEYTHAVCSVDTRTVSPTMQGCIDLIQSRPTVRKKDGVIVQATPEKPFANAAALELMAQLLYEQRVKEKDYVRWVPRGNSTMQDEARVQVRRAFFQTAPAEKSDTDVSKNAGPVSVGAHAEHSADCDVHQGKRCDC